MEQMREIVDIRTVDTAIKIGGAVWLAACLVVGVVTMAIRRAGPGPLIRGLFAGVVGPLLIGLWVFHLWMTRYDPQTGYFGLDKVWVLAVNAVVFVVVGAVYGCLAARLWAGTAGTAQEAIPAQKPNGR